MRHKDMKENSVSTVYNMIRMQADESLCIRTRANLLTKHNKFMLFFVDEWEKEKK